MTHLLRVVALVLAGSALGLKLLSYPHKAERNPPDEVLQLLAAVLGACTGLALELVIRLLIWRRWRFSLLEVFVASTLAATLAVLCRMLFG